MRTTAAPVRSGFSGGRSKQPPGSTGQRAALVVHPNQNVGHGRGKWEIGLAGMAENDEDAAAIGRCVLKTRQHAGGLSDTMEPVAPETAGGSCLGVESAIDSSRSAGIVGRRDAGDGVEIRGEFGDRADETGARPMTMRSQGIAARAAGLVVLAACAAGQVGCASGPSAWSLPSFAQVFAPAPPLPNPLPVPAGRLRGRLEQDRRRGQQAFPDRLRESAGADHPHR